MDMIVVDGKRYRPEDAARLLPPPEVLEDEATEEPEVPAKEASRPRNKARVPANKADTAS